MSENVATFRRGLDAYNRRDLDSLLAVLDPDVEWYPVLEVLLGGEGAAYRGHEGVRQLFRDVDAAMGAIRVDVPEIVADHGSFVVARGRLVARGKESGAETETNIGWLAEFSEGKIVRVRSYLTVAEALEASRLELNPPND